MGLGPRFIPVAKSAKTLPQAQEKEPRANDYSADEKLTDYPHALFFRCLRLRSIFFLLCVRIFLFFLFLPQGIFPHFV